MSARVVRAAAARRRERKTVLGAVIPPLSTSSPPPKARERAIDASRTKTGRRDGGAAGGRGALRRHFPVEMGGLTAKNEPGEMLNVNDFSLLRWSDPAGIDRRNPTCSSR
jgi:hypothetical protein